MACLANTFDLLGEDSDDVCRVVSIVDVKQDAAGFLAAEKKRKEEAKTKEEEEERQRQIREDTVLAVKLVLAVPAHRSFSFRRRLNYPQYNDEQHQGQRQGVQAPVVKKSWGPKSQSEQVQVTPKEEAKKEKVTRGSDAAVEKQQTKEEEGVNSNGGDVTSSTKSVYGKTRKSKNGSMRRKQRKQKAAAGGEKKEGEDTNQEGDTSSVQSRAVARSYTFKEYEEMKKRESLKDNGSNSAHHQPQPKKVTIDVNTELRTPQGYVRQRSFDNEGRRFNNGGHRYEGRRFDNGGRRFNNEGQRVNNGGQRSNTLGQRLKFNFDNAAEFPSLGRK